MCGWDVAGPAFSGAAQLAVGLEQFLMLPWIFGSAVQHTGSGKVTHASLLEGSNFVRTLTLRQGLQVGSPDEVAYQKKWITP